MSVGSQMPELDRWGGFLPPYKMISQNTPYKLGLTFFFWGGGSECVTKCQFLLIF